jgi:hypothetical protein
MTEILPGSGTLLTQRIGRAYQAHSQIWHDSLKRLNYGRAGITRMITGGLIACEVLRSSSKDLLLPMLSRPIRALTNVQSNHSSHAFVQEYILRCSLVLASNCIVWSVKYSKFAGSSSALV